MPLTPAWVALNGPSEIVAAPGHELPPNHRASDYDVVIPLGLEGLRGLVASAIEHAHLLRKTLHQEQWSRELNLAVTNLEQSALWLLADEMTDRQAWPGGLTDALLGI